MAPASGSAYGPDSEHQLEQVGQHTDPTANISSSMMTVISIVSLPGNPHSNQHSNQHARLAAREVGSKAPGYVPMACNDPMIQ